MKNLLRWAKNINWCQFGFHKLMIKKNFAVTSEVECARCRKQFIGTPDGPIQK